MKIVGFEKLSLVDYDGYTACTLFTAGCNFRCPFCHNGPLVVGGELASFTDEEIFSYLQKRRGILEGVVITGGEPTLQSGLIDYMARIKSMGYMCKLDTNGTSPSTIERAINEGVVDYIAMDVKSSPEGYPKATGVPFDEKIKKSVEILKQGKVAYEFRTTLVESLITSGDVKSMAEWLKGADKMVLQKFVEREGCIEKGLKEVNKQTALEYLDVLKKAGIPTVLRNYD